MNYFKSLILFITLFYIAGCATIGPTIIIETDEPAEYFVVLCKKTKSYLIGHNASGYDVVDNVIVTESGKEIDCGIMLGGGNSRVSVLHPVLTSDGKSNYTKEGVKHLVYNKTKLDILDEQKAKFEAGFWDKHENPGFKYAVEVGLVCGLPLQYTKYYLEANGSIDIERFKRVYDARMLQCVERMVPIVRKYRYPNLSSPRKRMDHLWKNIQSTMEKSQ